MGMLERGGKVKTAVIGHTRTESIVLQQIVRENG